MPKKGNGFLSDAETPISSQSENKPLLTLVSKNLKL